MQKPTKTPKDKVVTESFLKKTLKDSFEEYDIKMDMKFSTWATLLQEDFQKAHEELNNKMMKGFDKVMGRLDNFAIYQTSKIPGVSGKYEVRAKS